MESFPKTATWAGSSKVSDCDSWVSGWAWAMMGGGRGTGITSMKYKDVSSRRDALVLAASALTLESGMFSVDAAGTVLAWLFSVVRTFFFFLLRTFFIPGVGAGLASSVRSTKFGGDGDDSVRSIISGSIGTTSDLKYYFWIRV